MNLAGWIVILVLAWFLWQAGMAVYALGVLILGVVFSLAAPAPAAAKGGGGGEAPAAAGGPIYPEKMSINFRPDWKGEGGPGFMDWGETVAKAVAIPIKIFGDILKSGGEGGGEKKK